MMAGCHAPSHAPSIPFFIPFSSSSPQCPARVHLRPSGRRLAQCGPRSAS